jgi:ribosomal protein S12 methylthiotransferase accessory factor
MNTPILRTEELKAYYVLDVHGTQKVVKAVDEVDLEIQVPEDFPEKYRDSLVRSAELCAVKKHLERPPEFDVYTKEVSLV